MEREVDGSAVRLRHAPIDRQGGEGRSGLKQKGGDAGYKNAGQLRLAGWTRCVRMCMDGNVTRSPVEPPPSLRPSPIPPTHPYPPSRATTLTATHAPLPPNPRLSHSPWNMPSTA